MVSPAQRQVDLASAIRRIEAAVGSVWQRLTPRVLRALMAASIIASFAYFQLTYPITVGDTDMWYHLADGRYMVEQGGFADTFYYSFVGWPEGPGLHSWLFQLTIYLAHEAAGYWGLLLLRASLSIAGVCLVVWLTLFPPADAGRSRATVLGLGLLTLTVCLILLSKTYQLRPHLLSIIFILLTILVFERKRLYWTLPPIALLWANLHGVEWVVGGVIAFAYIVESVIRRLRDPSQPIPLQPVTWSVLAALALIVNPAGLQLFLPALDNNPDFQKFVQEMQPVQLGFLVSPSLSRLSISPVTAAPIAGFLSLLAWLSLAVGHRLRISHAIMSVAGLILLVQGVRFFAEWALLSLPMLSSFVAAWANRAASWVPSQPWLRTVLAGWIVAMPVFSFPSNGLVVGQLPFQSAGLPTGISDFLLANNATGKLLAPPGLAGYFAWTLYPGIRIFSDMKHHDIATFYNLSAIRNEHALKRVLDIHAPDFVAVTIGDKALENRLRSNGKFEAVFFDDQFVLYSDAARHPELEGVSFRALDPHTLTFKDSDRAQAIAELNRVADQDPRGRRVRQALWRLSYNEKDYAAAERQAEAILIAHPGDPNALFMRASTLEQSGRHREALAIFSGIFPFLSADSKRSVRRHQGSCYYLDQDFGRAYAAFHEGINPYRDEVEPEYLFQYAFVAAIEGEPREAKRALEMLFFLIDPKDANLHQKATELLRTIQSNEFEDIGWF